MARDSIDYDGLVRRALLGVVANTLRQVAARGLPGDHHLYLTFRTGDAGVALPDWLHASHPETMTVVLQHQFEGLEVDPAGPQGDLGGGFGVTLRFSGRPARLRVPFSALTSFADPSVGFGLTLTAGADEGAPPPVPAPVDGEPEADERPSGNVVRFRPRSG